MDDRMEFTVQTNSGSSLLDIRSKNAYEFCILELEGKHKGYNTTVNEVNFKINHKFDHQLWSNIINKFKDIFVDLHDKVERNEKEKALSNLCLEANQNYIRAIEDELNNFVATDETYQDSEEITGSLKVILKIWKLCEIIFIKASSCLLLDLQEWYQTTENLDDLVSKLIDESKSSNEPVSNRDDYWFLVILATFQGRIDVTRYLLSLNPNKNRKTFKLVDDLLRRMPEFKSLTYLTHGEFRAKWEFWQKECLAETKDVDFNSDEALEKICKILCADRTTFFQFKNCFNSWYYMLISWLSYSNPTFNITDLNLQLASSEWLRQFDKLDEFDHLIYSIFSFDIRSVLRESVELCSNSLFTAHLMDIFFLNGKLQLIKENDNEDLNRLYEEHLSEYGSSLLPYKGLWLNGCEYLLRCSECINGIEIIESHIERTPFESEEDALNLFQTSLKFQLQDQAYSIGRIMQIRSFKCEQYDVTLKWCIKIKDPSFGTLLGNALMSHYIEKKDEKYLDLVHKHCEEVVFCDRLVFISKFSEYLKLFKNGNYKEAASLIVQLLEAPQLIPVMFKEFVILELEDLLNKWTLSEDQIICILRTIQNLQNRLKTFNEFTIQTQINDKTDRSLRKFESNDLTNIRNKLNAQLSKSFSSKSIEIPN